MDWKLQNKREKSSISQTKVLYKYVGNIDKLAKNRQVRITNMKWN